MKTLSKLAHIEHPTNKIENFITVVGLEVNNDFTSIDSTWLQSTLSEIQQIPLIELGFKLLNELNTLYLHIFCCNLIFFLFSSRNSLSNSTLFAPFWQEKLQSLQLKEINTPAANIITIISSYSSF